MTPNRETPIIGIYSPYPGAGKSTVATRLNLRFGFARLKMAGPLKDMLRQYLASQGVEASSIEEMIEGGLKSTTLDVLAGRTPRHAMQTLGTEWGRNCMGENFWCDAAKAKILQSTKSGVAVVVDDVRFPNEAQMIHDIGGYMVRVRRPQIEQSNLPVRNWRNFFKSAARGHTSEGSLNDWPFDLDITNQYSNPADFADNAAAEIITLIHSGKSERAPPFIGR